MFDGRCPRCGQITQDIFVMTPPRDPRLLDVPCSQCQHHPLEKMQAAPAFVVHGYNAHNGYTKSQGHGGN